MVSSDPSPESVFLHCGVWDEDFGDDEGGYRSPCQRKTKEELHRIKPTE